MITDEEYLKAIETKLNYERQHTMCLLPSHAHLTKKALEIYGFDESELNMARHEAWIEGGVWMLDECIKFLQKK